MISPWRAVCQTDNNFGNDGKLLTSLSTFQIDDAFCIGIDADSRILLGGSADKGECLGCRDWAIVRYMPNVINEINEYYFIIDNKIRVYPNPAQSEITIRNDSGYQIIKSTISDISGRQIGYFTGSKYYTASLESGNYYLTITLKNNITIYRQFIIHH